MPIKAEDAHIIAKWRNKKYKCFSSQSKVTTESTKLWIEKTENLYGVYVGGKIVGHFSISKENELGAVLKDPDYDKPVMKKAILSMIKKNTWLIVLADNQKAIKFYQLLGFKITGKETHDNLLHYRMVL